MIPCKNCITYAVCKRKHQVICTNLFAYIGTTKLLKPNFVKIHFLKKYVPNMQKVFNGTAYHNGYRLFYKLRLSENSVPSDALLYLSKIIHRSIKAKGNLNK